MVRVGGVVRVVRVGGLYIECKLYIVLGKEEVKDVLAFAACKDSSLTSATPGKEGRRKEEEEQEKKEKVF
ncbi:MAG: hypothetical protein SWX82_16430 [Cyanobacteriota bacterium]|nr:hypothetical protein [Cyanobacteriota bacterium]